jgi:carboxyl-terminal processing protease
MNSKLRLLLYSVSVVVVLFLGLTAGVILDRQFIAITNGRASAQDPSINTNLIIEAWNLIQKNYADQSALKPTDLTYGAISGMVNALGDTGHSTFMTPGMLKEAHNSLQGQFEGIGALMQMKDGFPTIVTPLDNSPAQKAGLHPGDVLLKVDGQDVTNLPLDQVVGKVLGPAGTQVTLSIQDPKTGNIRDVTITRARIELHNVTWQILPGTTVAHIRIAEFSQDVTKDLKTAIQDAKKQGATSVILDLRNNPGGYLDEAVGVASQFLKDGDVLLEKDSNGQEKNIPVKSGGIATDLPVAVLVNQGTASAAEIVSGALQDAQRAKVIGETTFGTGTVLNEFKLSDGSALRLATQLWLTPKGRVIWHQGITPDITVPLANDVTPLTPESEREMTADQLKASQDAQLLKALEILTIQ